MHREHPLRIVRYSIKNIWLLVFPLLRNAFRQPASPEAFFRWMEGTWFDILILLLILGFGWLRWYCRKFSVENGDICLHEGILLRRIRFLPMERLSVLTLEAPWWLRPMKVVRLYANTAAGSTRSNDLRLFIRREDAVIFQKALPKLRYEEQHRFHHKVHPWRILLFSVIFSSSLSGALYTAAFWFQGGRIIRDLIEEFNLVQRLSAVSEEVARHLYGISPAAVTIAIVILSTWLLSLISNLLRYGSFSMETDKRLLYIHSGILTKRSHFLQNDRINFLDIRQNLLTKLCRVFSLALNCPGYGSQRGTIPVCLPILKQQELDATLPLLFPGASLTPNALRPRLTAWWGYVWAPVLGAAAIVPAALLLRHIFPRVESIIGFLQLMLLIPVLWKLLVQIAALLTSGVSMADSRICLRYCRGFVFHTIIAESSRLVKMEIRRNPFQRIFGKCDAVFYFRSERRQKCVVRNLDYQRVLEL